MFEICVGYLILGVLLGLGIAIFSYKISNMNTKEGTPSASDNTRSSKLLCYCCGDELPIEGNVYHDHGVFVCSECSAK